MSRIIIDYDGVIANTIKAITTLYNIDYHNHPRYEEVKWQNVKTWDFVELNCADKKRIDGYFEDPRFFMVVQLMDEAKEVIDFLSKKHSIAICTLGTKDNLTQKKKQLESLFPYAEFIPVDINKYADKSHIDMSGAVFIDDSSGNLHTSNARLKILFGEEYPWNQDWNGIKAKNWNEVKNIIARG